MNKEAMIKTAENLDFYDDAKGEVLKKRFPNEGDLPEIIKEGSFLSEKERENLPDNLFALVLTDGNTKLKKFACTDKCNTALSVMYFMDNARDKLPPEMQKVAAKSLLTACKWYDMTPPAELIKIAGETSANFLSPTIELDTIKNPPEQIKHADYCLPENEKYPIHSYRQITEAIKYFEKNATKFEPHIRREYCQNLEKKACEVGIPLPDSIKHYASKEPKSKLAVDEQFALRMRKTANSKYEGAYYALHKKAHEVPPELLARSLEELDKRANLDILWDEGIQDPWKTCYALSKIASYSFNDSTGYITEIDLQKLTEYSTLLKRAFPDDFVAGFVKKPLETFKALPLDQKRVIIRFVKTLNAS